MWKHDFQTKILETVFDCIVGSIKFGFFQIGFSFFICLSFVKTLQCSVVARFCFYKICFVQPHTMLEGLTLQVVILIGKLKKHSFRFLIFSSLIHASNNKVSVKDKPVNIILCGALSRLDRALDTKIHELIESISNPIRFDIVRECDVWLWIKSNDFH